MFAFLFDLVFLYLKKKLFLLTSGNPCSSVAPDEDNHFFGRESSDSFHPKNKKKEKNK